MPSSITPQILIYLEALTTRRPHIKNILVDEKDNTKLIAKVKCPTCQRDYEVHGITLDGLVAWITTQKIQHALPMLNANERELLLTGTCSSCWEDIFIDAEDDVEPEGEPE